MDVAVIEVSDRIADFDFTFSMSAYKTIIWADPGGSEYGCISGYTDAC
jgi:hypothetical protein